MVKGTVLLATVYYHPNYGSVLQAFATQKVISELGLNAKTIDCSIINKQVKRKKILYYIKNFYHKDLFWGQIKKYTISFHKIFDKAFSFNIELRKKAFEGYKKEKFHLTQALPLNEISQLCNGEVAAVVVGSDQLWLPSNINADYFTLNYIPDNVKKISYGTSFGIDKLPEKLEKRTAEFLKRFDYISVREKSGIDIITKISNKKAFLVCDPTLLLDAKVWEQEISDTRIVEDKYCFCYFLGSNPAHRQFVKSLSNKMGHKIVNLPHMEEYITADEKYADISLYDVSPIDFLNLIYYAEYIFTDSFHGSVFSIIFNKNFYTFRRFKSNSEASTNSRLDNLLEMCGLQERLIEDVKLENDIKLNNLDYEMVNKKVDAIRENSYKFLKRSLGEEE